jgi:ankyrin repeat protein
MLFAGTALAADKPGTDPSARSTPVVQQQHAHASIASVANAIPKLKRRVRVMFTYMNQPTYDSPLCEAVLEGDAAEVRRLLGSGVDPNQTVSSTGRNALIVATYNFDPLIYKLLLYAGADPNASDNHNDTPLHFAAWKNLPQAVGLLLAHGADINACNFSKQTALWVVCAYSMEDWITGKHDRALAGGTTLLEAGADPNLPDESGSTPLQISLITRWPEMAQLLLEHGAQDDVLSASIRGNIHALDQMVSAPGFDPASDAAQLALRYAVYRRQPEAAQLLLAHGVAPSLHIAAGLGDTAQIEQFLAEGVDVQARLNSVHGADLSYQFPSPLHWAAATGQAAAIRLLVARGAQPDYAPDEYTGPPIGSAIGERQLDGLTALLEAGANPDIELRSWGRPLKGVIHNDWPEAVDVLLKFGADPEYGSESWPHEPMLAASFGHARAMKLLLDAGVKPVNPERSNLFQNAIGIAGQKPGGARECIRLLLGAGLDPNEWEFASPLLEAIRAGQEDIALLLLNGGANPTAEDAYHLPPLHVATLYGQSRLTRALLALKVDVNKHAAGTTALALALKGEQPAVARVLRSHGAGEPSPVDLEMAVQLVAEEKEKPKQR